MLVQWKICPGFALNVLTWYPALLGSQGKCLSLRHMSCPRQKAGLELGLRAQDSRDPEEGAWLVFATSPGTARRKQCFHLPPGVRACWASTAWSRNRNLPPTQLFQKTGLALNISGVSGGCVE